MVGKPLANVPPEVLRRMQAGLRARSLAADPELAGAPTELGEDEGTWGSGGASVSTDYGTILSARLKRASEKDKYPDNNGETTGYIFYDLRTEGSFQALVQGTLDPGDTVSIGGETLVVDDAEKQWEYKGWAKYQVNASKHDGVTLGA
jgi:hypothetical protein